MKNHRLTETVVRYSTLQATESCFLLFLSQTNGKSYSFHFTFSAPECISFRIFRAGFQPAACPLCKKRTEILLSILALYDILCIPQLTWFSPPHPPAGAFATRLSASHY